MTISNATRVQTRPCTTQFECLKSRRPNASWTRHPTWFALVAESATCAPLSNFWPENEHSTPIHGKHVAVSYREVLVRNLAGLNPGRSLVVPVYHLYSYMSPEAQKVSGNSSYEKQDIETVLSSISALDILLREKTNLSKMEL